MSEPRLITCPCISDTFVRRNTLIQNFFSAGIDIWTEFEGENNGNSRTLSFGFNQEVTGIPQIQQTTTEQDHRAIVQFDLSAAMLMGEVRSAKLRLFSPPGTWGFQHVLQITPVTMQGSVIVEDNLVFGRWNQAVREPTNLPMQNSGVNEPNPQFDAEFNPNVPAMIPVMQTVDWVRPDREISPWGGEYDVTHLFDRGRIQQNVLTFALMSIGGPRRAQSPRSNTIVTMLSRESGANTAPALILECVPRLGSAPTNLAPTAVQNPRLPIRISWRHTPNPAIPRGLVDPQTDSWVFLWQQSTGRDNGLMVNGGIDNFVEISANTFVTLEPVRFLARTDTEHNGEGAWSAEFSFNLALNPSLAPTVTAPQAANRHRDIRVFWRFNASRIGDSQTDSELEYRQGGSGAWAAIAGGTANSAIIFADTFSANTSVQVRARTRSVLGEWGAWSAISTISLYVAPPLAPVDLLPTVIQNRRVNINLSWRHVPNPNDWDSQVDSIVEFWQANNQRRQIWAGTTNRLELPSDTFTDNRTVYWRVRTVTLRNGEGEWSTVSSFPLDSFAPSPPIDLSPTSVMNPRVSINLTWRFVANERWFPNDGQIDSETEVWQGTGTRFTFRGYSDNRAIVPANTFVGLAPINFRARTRTNLGGWGEFSPTVTIPLAISPPLAPINLRPTAPQNPRGTIRLFWTHVPNPEMPNDRQVDAEVRLEQGGIMVFRAIVGNAYNYFDVPASTFSSYAPVNFYVRTSSEINGWGDWSSSEEGRERFELRMTPPLPPELLFPVNIAVLPNNIFLQWSYNSPFDTFPSRFDIRHRIDGGAWINNQTNSLGGVPAPNNLTINVNNSQSRMEWQVRAWGALGDVGEWSNVGVAFIMGIPATPVIVQISNSNRPNIVYSAINAMAWELEIFQGVNRIYTTGERAFEGIFTHQPLEFLPNGSYTARLRIINEYGLYSNWASRNFTILVTPPEAVELRTANNLLYNTRLWFEGAGRDVYIYRAKVESDDFTNIAHVNNANNWEDWTVQPGQRYKYFIRVVGENFAFADSRIESAIANFKDTTIAIAEKPQNMVKLLYQLGVKPTKNSEFEKEKNLTHFAGREKPVLQVGTHSSRVLNLEFYVTLSEREKLEEFAQSGDVLILRDWRLGVVYGTITGGLRVMAGGISGFCQVSFGFTETDYSILS